MLPAMPDQALHAAVEVAAAHGVRCGEPAVLANGSNVLVHLAPAPIVARVAALTGLVRSDVDVTLAKDVAVAGWLAGQGAPVVAPSGELPAGPHRSSGGRTVTFWTYVPHDRDHVWRPDEVGPLLADLHSALRAYPGELPRMPPIEVMAVTDVLRRLDALDPLVEAEIPDLLADAARVGEELAAAGDPVPLHGDAHPGNLMYTRAGPVWTDFEDAWFGPIGWDLACLELTNQLDGWAAVAGYPGAPDESARAPFLAGRRLAVLLWSLVFQWRFPTAERQADIEAQVRAWRSGR
jgi:Phosphotransferase enzyme family